MKHSIIILPILVLLASCASNVKKSNDSLVGIENADFKPKKTVRYISKKDVFQAPTSKADSISKESVNRLPSPKLIELEAGEDPINKAIALCYLKKFSAANKIFDQQYAKYHKSPSYWNQVGTCYLLQNEKRKALLYYTKAKDLNRRYAPALNNTGVIFYQEGKTEMALEAFKRASKVSSFSLTPLFNMATIYMKYGFKDKAYNIYNVLYKKNRFDVDVLNGLGTYFLMNGEPKKAITYYSQIDDDYLRRADISISYAYALKMVGENSDARDLFRKINTKKLNDLAYYYTRVKKVIEE